MTRHALFFLGCVSLALGVLGTFLPLLPTTPFLLLTAWCFLKSSPKAHAWLHRQKYIGPILLDWETRGAISKTTKITAIFLILISLILIWVRVQYFGLQIAVTLLLIAVSTFILTRPSR